MSDNLLPRLVGESYKDYAARMAGWARAAERDRDVALARVAELETGEKRTEWGVRLRAGGDVPEWPDMSSEQNARDLAHLHGATVRRDVRTGPWVPADETGATT